VVSDVFGVPLLLNFMASSLLVCLVGFQLTIDYSPEYFGKQVLLLALALAEVYLLYSSLSINQGKVYPFKQAISE